MSADSPYSKIVASLQEIRSQLDLLTCVNVDNMLIPGELEKHYHQIVEKAYAVLGLVKTQVDELWAELEYQHKRLDEMRDAVSRDVSMTMQTTEKEQGE